MTKRISLLLLPSLPPLGIVPVSAFSPVVVFPPSTVALLPVNLAGRNGRGRTSSSLFAVEAEDPPSPSPSSPSPPRPIEIATSERIIERGREVGVELSLTTLGPGFRAVARSCHNSSQVIGYVEGFVRPGGRILHLDKMEVWKKAVRLAREENPEGYRDGGNAFGVGFLLGYLCLLHGRDGGGRCKTAEFLAIDDGERQHERLVRYYRRSGFKVIKYVGDGPGDIPDRLIWGGRGTLMREEVGTLLESWTGYLFGR